MTVPVNMARLRGETERFGSVAFLLTVSDDGRPHAVSVPVAWAGDDLVAEAGRRTARNAVARPAVSVLWPPFEPGGYSLIVDGEAGVSVLDDPGREGGRVVVRPTAAVLHRSPAGPDGQGACGSDCVPVLRP